MNARSGLILAAVTSCVLPIKCLAVSFVRQNPDQDAVRSILDNSREVVRTAAIQAHRFETDHVIVHIDKDLLTTEAEQEFARTIERIFVATSAFLQRGFDETSRKTRKPAYYLTNRAGISHAEATQLFLNARRVIPSPAIAIHETVHLLLMKNPESPRNRSDLTPEEDARLAATSGMWLAEGFAGYVGYELAPTLNMAPDRLFVTGDKGTVDGEARQWLRDARGTKVLTFVGAHGVPDGLVADRPNVAAPFYVLGQSFVKYLVQQTDMAVIARLYEEHFDGTRSIEEDVTRITGRSLAQWRTEWLQAIGAGR